MVIVEYKSIAPMNLRFKAFLSISVFFFTSCKKEEMSLLNSISNLYYNEAGTDSLLPMYEKWDDTHYHGVIFLNYPGYGDYLSYEMFAAFYDDLLGNMQDANLETQRFAGNLSVNGKSFITMNYGNNVFYSFTKQPNEEPNEINCLEVASFLGNTIQLSKEGYGDFPPLQTSFYVPKKLQLILNNSTFTPVIIEKNKGYLLQWTPDEIDQGIVIYMAGAQNFQPTANEQLIILVKDDGEFFITPELLKKVNGNTLQISMHRIRYKNIEMQGKVYRIVCTMDAGLVAEIK